MLPRMVISVDGLSARFLGAYGNSWVPTPTIDSLASQGLVFDQYFAEHGSPGTLFEALLTGKHPLITRSANFDINQHATKPADETLLVSDYLEFPPQVTGFFTNHLELRPEMDLSQESAGGSDESNGDTLEQVFESAFAAIEDLQMWNRDCRIWIHCHGMYGNWNAPLEFQELFKGEEDPDPIETGTAPSTILPPEHDPDERVRWQHAYAAQVMHLDQVLGDFLSVVWDKQPNLPITLCGLRGFPLGEHLEIGDMGTALHVEKTHLPLIHIDHREAPLRISKLLGSHCFRELIWQEGYKQSLRQLVEEERESSEIQILTTAHNSHARLQTQGWSYLQELDQGVPVDQPGKLYRMPDDRLESNNVAEICPEVVEELNAELKRRLLCYQAGNEPSILGLSEQATFGFE